MSYLVGVFALFYNFLHNIFRFPERDAFFGSCREAQLSKVESFANSLWRNSHIITMGSKRSRWHRLTASIWHDTLRSLRDISTESDMKAKVVEIWLEYGAAFVLSEGVSVLTLQIPSTRSDTTPYWKIQKHCFWAACGCWHGETLPHSLRVCKGCWRVLYCSPYAKRCEYFEHSHCVLL